MKTKLTKRNIDAIQAGGRDQYFYDTELPNFGLKVTPHGRKVYFVQYWSGQARRRYTIGPHGPLTPEQARIEAKRILGETAQGADPARQVVLKRQAPTVAELVERYLTEHAEPKKKPSSVKKDRQWLARFIVPQLGKLRVHEVSRADVSSLHHALRETPYQANRCLEVLRKMFNLAELWGLRPDGSNPCRHVQKFKEEKRKRFLTPEELARLGATLAEAEHEGVELPGVLTALRLLLFTGCRLGEILSLRWTHVDWSAGCLRLPDSKTGAKDVALGEPALEIILAGREESQGPFVCPGISPDAPLVGIHRAWYRVRSRAGLEGVRLHDLRHSFASVGVAAGLGLPIVGALLGHTQAATTQRYAHLAADPVKAAADEITRRIAEAMHRPIGGKVVLIRRSS